MTCHPDTLLIQEIPAPAAATEHVRGLIDAEHQWVASQYGDVEGRGPASVGIVGAGVMGTSIAAAVIRGGIPVRIVDRDEQALATAPRRIAQRLNDLSGGAQGMPPDPERWLWTSQHLSAVAGCDLVVESVVERLLEKQQLLAQLEPLLAPDAVVASNTSTIPWARLAMSLQDPGRLCGCHFFLPVGQTAMLEIVRGEKTRRATIVAAVRFASAIGHLPLVVDDAPGFVVNRLLVPYLSEAMQLLTEGATLDQVERAAEAFGMARGPLRLLDEVGLDTALECAWTMAGSSADLVVRSPLLVAMVKAKQLGRKTQAGFYLYEGPDQPPRSPNPHLAEMLARWSRDKRSHTAETILLRLLTPMLLEATRMLQRGSVRDAGQLDLAILCGFGFPVARGGLLYWLDHVGLGRIVPLLRTLDDLGPRAQPTPLLLEMAQQDGKFYGS